MSAQIWMGSLDEPGRLCPMEEARVSPLAHCLHYGTGVFEGVRCYATSKGPAIFRLPEHLGRMKRGAEIMAMPLDEERLTHASCEVVRANKLEAAYLRPIAYYADGGLGLDVGPLKPRYAVAALPVYRHLDTGENVGGVRMRTSSYRRNPATSMPPLKICGGYVNSILAKLEATRHGYGEALFVDDRGFVCEATGENAFIVKNKKIIAIQHADALPGITRATVIALTGAEERPVTIDELRDADEIFLTGTSAEIAAVVHMDDRAMPPGPVTAELAKRYQAIVHGESETERGWLLHI